MTLNLSVPNVDGEDNATDQANGVGNEALHKPSLYDKEIFFLRELEKRSTVA